MIINTDSIDVVNDVLNIAGESKVALHNSRTNMWEIDEWDEWFDSVINWGHIDAVKVAYENDLIDYPVKMARQIIACKEHVDLFIQSNWLDWVTAFTDDREIILCKVKGSKKHIIHRQWDEDPGIIWTEFYVVEPDQKSINVVLDEGISPRHERVTPMEEGYDDE